MKNSYSVAIFAVRRIAVGLLVLLIASALIYWMVSIATDYQALVEFESSTAPNKEALIEQRVQLLRLDEPWIARYWDWLLAFISGDMGSSWRTNIPVGELIGQSAIATIRLVSAATFLSILMGITIGIISALRQYSTFDYIVTFFSFLMFALPSFWVAVLLKQFAAIGFNNFLLGDGVSVPVIIGVSVVLGLLWSLALGGDTRRRVINGVGAAVATGIVFTYLNLSNWWHQPRLGMLVIAVLGTGIAIGVTSLSTGLRNRPSLFTALSCVALGLILYLPLQSVFRQLTPQMSMPMLLAGGLVCIAVGVGIGFLWGGPDRGQSMRTGGITAPIIATLIVLDKVLSYWPQYSERLDGKPVPTIGDQTPNLGGNFWVQLLDQGMHLVLPTMALLLISFPVYTRYSRGSMLEVMNADYIRTARSKGLTERTVVMRHGFRNALIPLATLVPLDIITLLGGAIITEGIFGIPGMGQLFLTNLRAGDIEPVMAYLIIVAALAVLANIVSDLVYAALDPRIRVNA